MKNLGQKADRLAARYQRPADDYTRDAGNCWDALRDFVDFETGGDLDGFALDLLTEAVASRLTKEMESK